MLVFNRFENLDGDQKMWLNLIKEEIGLSNWDVGIFKIEISFYNLTTDESGGGGGGGGADPGLGTTAGVDWDRRVHWS